MSKQFLKKGEVKLVNGGYLSNSDDKPISNAEFVAAQKEAEYIVTFAEMAKDKDFKGKHADSLELFVEEVNKKVYGNTKTEFIKDPKKVKLKLTEQLKQEGLDFHKFNEEKLKIRKINKFLQKFNAINEFERFGLFFEEDIVKLNKIYTMEEIIESAKSVIDIID